MPGQPELSPDPAQPKSNRRRQPSPSPPGLKGRSVAAMLDDRIAVWVYEGGAGGEVQR